MIPAPGPCTPGPAAPGPAIPGPSTLRVSDPRGRAVVLTTVLGSGLSLLDSTIVNVALPTIGRDLKADLAGLQWVISAYALTLAALILLGGSLGDRFGRRRIFMWGVAGFGVASMLSALSPTIWTLVGARALQGVAAALLTPGSLAILQSSFMPADRMRAIGTWTGSLSIAAASGPLVGGWLVGYSWRWAFWVNVPLCVVVILLAVRFVPESRNPTASMTIDIPGVVLGASGLAGVTYALTAWPAQGLSGYTVISGAGGVLTLGAFIVTERRSRHPMLPTSLFASRTFSVINSVTFAIYAALSGALVFLVLFLQVVSGMDGAAGRHRHPAVERGHARARQPLRHTGHQGGRPSFHDRRAAHRGNGIRAHVALTQPPVIRPGCPARSCPPGAGSGHDRRAADRNRPRGRPR